MGWSIGIESSQSQNAAGNQSTVTASIRVYWSNGSAYANYNQEGYITIDGVESGAIALPTQLNYNPNTGGYASLSGSQIVATWSRTFTHDGNGYRGDVGTSGRVDGDYGYGLPDVSATGPTQGAINYNHSANVPYYDDITRTSLDIFRLGHAETGNVSGYGGTSYIMRSAKGDITTEGSHSGFDVYTGYTFSIFAAGVEGSWVAGTYNGNSWGPYYGKPRASTYTKASGSTTTAGQIELTWNAPSNSGNTGYGNVQYYHVYRNGSYIAQTSNAYYNDTGLIRGSNYYYDIYALGSSYWGDVASTYSYLGNNYIIGPGVPGKPSTVNTPTRIGRNVTVTASKDANGYGNAVTGYRIQYATSDDNYTTWYGWNGTSGVLNGYNVMDISGTEASFYYSMLTAAKTYKFRVYAVNSIGAGDQTTDSAVLATGWFLPASGKKWDGTSWNPTAIAKRWNPITSTWTDISIAKRYSSTTGNWEELT